MHWLNTEDYFGNFTWATMVLRVRAWLMGVQIARNRARRATYGGGLVEIARTSFHLGLGYPGRSSVEKRKLHSQVGLTGTKILAEYR
jgi:hypothetical protein